MENPRLDKLDDQDFLRYHWAISSSVLELCEHLRHNIHEVQSSLGTQMRVDDAMVRGRLDARKTLMARALSGHRSRVVFAESIRIYKSGPNHVLVWVLQRANLLLSRFMEQIGTTSSYAKPIAEAAQLISGARRVSTVAQAIADTDSTQRPSSQSLAQAAGSRKRLYRLAYRAYILLQKVEAGDPEAVVEMLNRTLLGPLHDWQTFELALALGMGIAFAKQSGGNIKLRRVSPGSGGVLIETGQCQIHWQNRTAAYRPPELEPSEILVNEILKSYRLNPGADRPDLVMTNSDGRVVAIAEAKFFTNEIESWPSAFRAAAVQLVRYSRGYAADGELAGLLGRSVIGLWHYPVESRPDLAPIDRPTVVDFSDLLEGRLEDWATRVAGDEMFHSAA